MFVQRFLQFAETATASDRAEATGALARAFLYSDLTDEQRAATETALTVLLDDPAPKVRLALAEALGADRKTPKHIILSLANDLPDVAALVLCRSPLILAEELIELIGRNNNTIQVAIACRQPLCATVVSELASKGGLQSCIALIQNDYLSLGRRLLSRIAERWGDDSHMRELLLDYPALPIEVRQQLVRQLGTALSNFVSAKNWVAEPRAEKIVTEACEKATAAMAGALGPKEMPDLVEHLRASGQLTTALLLRAICNGNVGVFEAAMANLASVPEVRVHRIVLSGHLPAMKAIYGKTDLPEGAFPIFSAAIEAWRNACLNGVDDADLPIQVMNRIMEACAGLPQPIRGTLLKMLRGLAAETARDAARLSADEIRLAA